PFSLLQQYTPYATSKRLIDVYISGFSIKERKSINLQENEKEIQAQPLFNYVTYLRELDVLQANSCILSWYLITFEGDFMKDSLPIMTVFLKHFVKNSPKITHLIFDFTLDNADEFYCKYNVNWKLLTFDNANNCFEQLKVLECHGDFNPKLLFF